jgi:peptidoglycan/LPS O-acetylase OafA/YrhL
LVLPGDYSFGIYIYGFPIQQAVQHFLPDLTSYPSNLICLPLALIAGYFSWTFIERPTLQKAQTLARAAPNPFGFLIRGRPDAQDLSTADDSVKDSRQ